MNAAARDSDTVFAQAIEIASSEERALFLEKACAHDPKLRREVEKLVRDHFRAGDFLESPASRFGATIDAPPAERPGTVIGPYKLLEQIGEGGMGLVFVAEQQQPVRRKVALKIIKPGMDSRQVVARFEAERQALALMDHQNIAKVFDAGTTESGRPYFVMELVHGVPITQYCDANQLTPRERLELFVPICQAIQHAHQKGIIHRDIKPSNILVTIYDDKPVSKVIDFGVAKAVEQRLTERTVYTQFGTLVGTLEYMSPEQAEMNAFGVDTRSDIYSLGVLLYELLTGTTPLERERLRQAALDELVRMIKQEEAPRPSARLSSSHNLPKIAAARKTEPARLSKLVRGEIDWIVMKCLEKDRSHRYDSASGLARDLERFLTDEPVEACPPSAAYRVSKFVRKYKTALAIVAGFAALLVVGLVTSTWLAIWAKSAEREANRQRLVSDEARQQALDARAEADKQRDEARLTAYATGMGLAQHAWEENNLLRARELLAEVPWEAAGRDLRGFEWYHLSRLCSAEVPTFKGHAGAITSVALSPDGRQLALGCEDTTVKIWDSGTGQELHSLKGNAGTVESVAFSPDGRRLVSGSGDKAVKIWDSTTGKELLSLKGHVKAVFSVAFSPDGRRVASASQDMTVKVWDAATGKKLVEFKGHEKPVRGVAFSPDGRRVASGGNDGTVRIWDSTSGKELVPPLTGHDGPVPSVAFSPDGRCIASGGTDKTVRIWDSTAGTVLRCVTGHRNVVHSVAYSPDGRCLASGSRDGAAKVWDSTTGKELSTLKGHDGLVRSVAFSPDGQHLFSGSTDGTVKIWDSVIDTQPFSLRGYAGPAWSVAFSPDGRRLASASEDGMVRVWDSITGQVLGFLEGHTSSVTRVAFSPDGRRLASASSDKSARIWDRTTGKQLVELDCCGHNVRGLAFSPDGRRLATACANGTVKLWDSATGKELLPLPGHDGAVTTVAYSPDGRLLASGSQDKTVKIWDSTTGEELLSLKGHTAPVQSVAFSPDSRRVASGGGDKTGKIWDSTTGRELVSLKGHAGSVGALAFSPDGRRLFSASADGTVKVWDSTTGKELVSLTGRGGMVMDIALRPDGQCLASANGDGFITLWETSVSPEVQERRAACQLVADLFRQLGSRATVLERLQTLPGMTPVRRREALAAAQTYPEEPR
jgi:WD40 repeat protein/serine/threonine protein kinase